MVLIKPYNNLKTKKEQVTTMFDNISEHYDFLNHTLSLGMDTKWRKRAIKQLINQPKKIIDIATGTGDFAISAAKYTNAQITGIDISQGMLDIGIQKVLKKKLGNRIILQKADSEKIPYPQKSFDAATVGFGVRNFENIEKGLHEIYRVLRTDGIVVILEPSSPKNFILKRLYKIYFHKILPIIGSWISNDKQAYKYLPESVEAFDSNNDFIKRLAKAGFYNCKCLPLTFGIVTMYVAIK